MTQISTNAKGLRASLCNGARLAFLVTALFLGLFNAAFANALVVCFGTDGHVAVELSLHEDHGKASGIYKPASNMGNQTVLTEVETFQNSDSCNDWMAATSTVSQRESLIQQELTVAIEVLPLTAELSIDSHKTVKNEFVEYSAAPPYPALDDLKTIVLLR